MPSTAVVKVRKLISANKAVAAGVTSLSGALAFAVASWIGSGEFNLTEIRLAGGALALAVITAGGTYAVSAGNAEVALAQDVGGAADVVVVEHPAPPKAQPYSKG